MAKQEQKVFVNFFDDSSLTSIELMEGTEVVIRSVGLKDEVSHTAPLSAKSKKGFQHVPLTGFLDRLEKEEKAREKEEEAEEEADEDEGEGKDKRGKKVPPRRIVAELRLKNNYELGCTTYTGPGVIIDLPAAEEDDLRKKQKKEKKEAAEDEDDADDAEVECCCIPFPLHKLAETCTIKFRAFDASTVDFIEHAEAFRKNVEWVVTAVRTPAHAAATPAKSTALARTGAHAAPSKFQSWVGSIKGVEGCGEMFEVPLHQLYQIDARAPEGYICMGSALQYRYICCERTLEITSYFRPCGMCPARSVVFVNQKCQGVRWGNATVLLGGTEVPVDQDGIMKVPDGMNGVFPLSAPGVTFFPPAINLSKGAPPVSTVAVADQPVTASGRTVRGRFVDNANSPFLHRTISVLLPNGDEIQVTTDDQGYFDAPVGSQVYAREDEWGLATEPLYLSEKSTS